MFVPILASRPVTAIAHRFFGCGVPIFMLHRADSAKHSNAGGTRPEHLRRCLQYLVEHNYNCISLQQLVTTLRDGQSLPHKSVVFTIDDGFTDQAEVAAPIFEEFNYPLTFFVITGMLNQVLWPWDAQVAWIAETSAIESLQTQVADKSFTLPLDSEINRRLAKRALHDAVREQPAEQVNGIIDQIARDAGVIVPDTPPANYQPINWEMARQLERKGIQFAPHSVTHNVLSRLDSDSLQHEISESWSTLERELHNPLKVFCYPTGRERDYGNREITALQQNGFLAAVTTTPGFVEQTCTSETSLFNLPRFPLPESMDDFIQCCTWIEYVKSHQRKQRV